MGGSKKQTKKFLKNSLKGELERRKKVKPLKQRHAKRFARKEAKREESKEERSTAEVISGAMPLEDLDVDSFMASGFKDLLQGDDEGLDSDSNDAATHGASDEETDDSTADGQQRESVDHDGTSGSDSGDVDAETDASDAESELDDDGDESLLHKKQLETLKKTQPEFFKFLEQNDKSLLDFAEPESPESSDGESSDGESPVEQPSDDDFFDDEEDDDAPDEPETDLHEGKKKEMSMSLVEKWERLLKSHSISGVRHAIDGFQAACSFASDGTQESVHGGSRYSIKSAKVFNSVVQQALTLVPDALNALLPVAAPKTGRGAPLPSTSAGWKKIRGAVKKLLLGVITLQEHLTDTDALCYVLQQSSALAPYFACFPKLNRLEFKRVLHVWSHADPHARLLAFLVIRKMTIVSPHPFIELALKGVYLTFIRSCKFPTPSVKPTLTFMLNCVVELYRLDAAASYQHAFVYIRQLAIHLRNATVAKKKGSHLQVYNWQYVYALRVWAKLLGEVLANTEHPEMATTLKPLVYPLVQITLGAIRLVPASRYFPLRFHLLRLLTTLMEHSGIYMPLSTEIFVPFESHELKARPRASTERPFSFDTELKVSKARLNLPQFQDAVVDQALDIAWQYYGALAHSIAFPEAVFPDTIRIRTILKTVKNRNIVKQLRALLEKLEENTKYINAERAHVPFSPKDVAKVSKWESDLAAKGKSPLARHYKVHLSSRAVKSTMQAATQIVEGDDYEATANSDSEEDASHDEESSTKAVKRHRSEKNSSNKKRARVADNVDSADEAEDSVGDFSLKDFDFGSDSD